MQRILAQMIWIAKMPLEVFVWKVGDTLDACSFQLNTYGFAVFLSVFQKGTQRKSKHILHISNAFQRTIFHIFASHLAYH